MLDSTKSAITIVEFIIKRTWAGLREPSIC